MHHARTNYVCLFFCFLFFTKIKGGTNPFRFLFIVAMWTKVQCFLHDSKVSADLHILYVSPYDCLVNVPVNAFVLLLEVLLKKEMCLKIVRVGMCYTGMVFYVCVVFSVQMQASAFCQFTWLILLCFHCASLFILPWIYFVSCLHPCPVIDLVPDCECVQFLRSIAVKALMFYCLNCFNVKSLFSCLLSRIFLFLYLYLVFSS